MSNLTNKKWKAFLISDIFNVSGTVTTKPNSLIINGTTPRITCAATNNALDNFYKNPPTEKGNVITVDSATNGFVSYQGYDFIATDHVEKLQLKSRQCNVYIGLFFKQVIDNSILQKHNYGYKFSQTRIKKQKILLPINNDGSPDYEFMEAYIKEKVEKKRNEYLEYCKKQLEIIGRRQSLIPLQDKKWKVFKIVDLFNYKKGSQNKMNSLKLGNNVLISAKNINNGLKEFVEKNENKLYEKNTISLNNDGDGGVGLAYYHPYEYMLDSHCTSLKAKEEISRYAMKFICACIAKQRTLYSHGRSISEDRLKLMKIMLPINDINQPDYKYMEQYSRNILSDKLQSYSDYISNK